MTPKVLNVGEVEQAEVLPSGTVTFLFTDIEGSTPLWDAHPAAMRETLTRHDEIVRKAIDAADGYIFSTGGDGFGAVFTRAGNAVAAAVGAQRDLNAEPWPDDLELRVRMGLHTGEVQERDGDYFGPPVNRAARIMGAANGGQIVVSALAAELVGDAADVSLIDLGSVQLKGIVEPVHVFGVDTEGAAWIDRPLVSAQTSAGNLPRLQTELFTNLVDLQERVSALANARLVTLTGSGGVGKTRTAVEIGWLVVDEFVDGVWLIELGPIADPDVVIAALASTMSIQPQPEMSMLESIVDWCLGRRMLLIIDNCEHVLEPVMEVVAAIVNGCPMVTVIATSREPLGIQGERVIRIPSLASNYGVELFCDRALAADSSFVLAEQDDKTIASIVRRVDGIPLAIELAAARIRSLSPQELLDRLDDRFRLLRGGGRGGLERHQTLRAAVTWSYQLLSSPERLLFDRLSVFAGGFDLAAAETICSGDDIDEYDVIDLLGELVDKSMVVAERTDSTTRYRLLETLRQYGEEMLDNRDETTALRDQHLGYYCVVADDVGRGWWTPEQVQADALAECEWDNLRAAHGWAATTDDFDLAVRLLRGIASRSNMRLDNEGKEWVSQTFQVGERARRSSSDLYMMASGWAFIGGDLERVIDLTERGIEIAADHEQVVGHQTLRLYALAGSGRLQEAAALVPEIRNLISRSQAPAHLYSLQALIDLGIGEADIDDDIMMFTSIANELGAPSFLASVHRINGSRFLQSTEPRDIDGAIAEFSKAIDIARALGFLRIELVARSGIVAAMIYGDRPGATGSLGDLIFLANDARHMLVLLSSMEIEVFYLVGKSDLATAAVILGHIENRRQTTTMLGFMREANIAALIDLPDLDVLKARGAAMSRQEIVDFALAQLVV